MERIISAWSRLFIGTLIIVCFTAFKATRAHAQDENPVAAHVNGKVITQREVDDSIFPQILPLEQQIYALRKAALENLILRALLEEAAKKRGISVDELKKQLTTGKVEVTASEVEREYLQNASAFGAMSPDEAKERIRLSLESQERMKLYTDALAELRKNAHIEIRLDEPRLPFMGDVLGSPSIGSKNARVTIIEFSDFQCPFCRESVSVIKEVLETYKQDVRLVFKHLPLDIHERAFDSARAAFCAGEQDLFWPYHDFLFSSKELSPEALDRIASNVGLSMPKFKACLSSNVSREAVLREVQEAKRLGINSTPTFIINGRLIRGAITFDEFKTIVAEELESTRADHKKSQHSMKGSTRP